MGEAVPDLTERTYLGTQNFNRYLRIYEDRVAIVATLNSTVQIPTMVLG